MMNQHTGLKLKSLYKISRILIFIWIVLCANVLIDSVEAKSKNANKPIRQEGFLLKEVNNSYLPQLFGESITLPGTNIKVGTYKYVSRLGDEIVKLGFLFSSKRFYFVQSQEYSSLDDANYGVYNGYFIIDGYGYGSTSGHNRLMFLFKYNKDFVQLLDVIGQAYIGSFGMDFTSINNPGHVRRYLSPVLTDVKDIDGDGNPEIKLYVYSGETRSPKFELYFTISNDKLHVNLKSKLYKPLYEKVKRTTEGKSRPIAYYIYGFLAKQINMEMIKAKLRSDKSLNYVIKLLENADKWDSAFHECSDEKFNLIQYNLDRR